MARMKKNYPEMYDAVVRLQDRYDDLMVKPKEEVRELVQRTLLAFREEGCPYVFNDIIGKYVVKVR